MSKYSGTKTEKNLMEAFAGESQARNKYTFFASAAKKQDMSSWQLFIWKLPIRKKNTQKCGLRSFTEFTISTPILRMPLRVKTLNGQICMQEWQEKPEKKALKNWLKI